MTDEPEPMWRVADVVRTLNLSRSYVYKMAKEGRLPGHRIGGPEGPWRFRPADIRQLANGSCESGEA